MFNLIFELDSNFFELGLWKYSLLITIIINVTKEKGSICTRLILCVRYTRLTFGIAVGNIEAPSAGCQPHSASILHAVNAGKPSTPDHEAHKRA